MSRRVVITGMGIVAPVGNDLHSYWQNIKNGALGIDYVTRYDTSTYAVKIAAEVKNFHAEDFMPKKEIKRMDLFCQYAIAAASQAVDDSGLDLQEIDPRRFGVFVGSGIGGLTTMEEQVVRMHERGPNRVTPLFIPITIANMAAGNIAIKYGARGSCIAPVTACASGTQGIGEAYRSIKDGYTDVIIAGGAEAAVTGVGMAGFANLAALMETEDPERASIPFDKERKGFVLGEGAACLVLEDREAALKRGARIYAEVAGYGSTCDAYHMTAPSPEGIGAHEAMARAMEEAGVSAEDIGYINAHGTSTIPNDLVETIAIKKTLGENAYRVPISSSKSMIGHMLGAAGAAEAIVTVMAVAEGFAPPTIGYRVKDEECDLDYVPNTGRPVAIRYALSNSFGFGGHNAVICIKNTSEE